jgi:hypothetical protein
VPAVVRQVFVGPSDVTVTVAFAVPPDARLKLEGDTEHEGGWLVTGLTEQLNATVPANPLTLVPVTVHVLVVDSFSTGVTDNVEGLAASVKLLVEPVTPPPAAASRNCATSSDPNPVAWS